MSYIYHQPHSLQKIKHLNEWNLNNKYDISLNVQVV
jgi:hypothetical protein